MCQCAYADKVYAQFSDAADTLQIRFESGLNCNCTDSSGTCCFLFVDELSLELPNGLVELSGESTVGINYDAVANKIWLNESPKTSWHLRLVDVTGRELMRRENILGNAVELNERLPSGVYLFHAVIDGHAHAGKLFIR